MEMSKFFTKYVEEDYAAYVHSGVGYSGVSYSPDKYARKKHHGVGYGGIYD
jgi:hypothetical protein